MHKIKNKGIIDVKINIWCPCCGQMESECTCGCS